EILQLTSMLPSPDMASSPSVNIQSRYKEGSVKTLIISDAQNRQGSRGLNPGAIFYGTHRDRHQPPLHSCHGFLVPEFYAPRLRALQPNLPRAGFAPGNVPVHQSDY